MFCIKTIFTKGGIIAATLVVAKSLENGKTVKYNTESHFKIESVLFDALLPQCITAMNKDSLATIRSQVTSSAIHT